MIAAYDPETATKMHGWKRGCGSCSRDQDARAGSRVCFLSQKRENIPFFIGPNQDAHPHAPPVHLGPVLTPFGGLLFQDAHPSPHRASCRVARAFVGVPACGVRCRALACVEVGTVVAHLDEEGPEGRPRFSQKNATEAPSREQPTKYSFLRPPRYRRSFEDALRAGHRPPLFEIASPATGPDRRSTAGPPLAHPLRMTTATRYGHGRHPRSGSVCHRFAFKIFCGSGQRNDTPRGCRPKRKPTPSERPCCRERKPDVTSD
jgi:hypothetical protein